MLKGDRERGCAALGSGEMVDVGACAACDWDRERDMDRSEVGVLSSTAELEGCC